MTVIKGMHLESEMRQGYNAIKHLVTKPELQDIKEDQAPRPRVTLD